MEATLSGVSKIAFGGIEQKLEINGEPTQTKPFPREFTTPKVAAVGCYCGKTYALTTTSNCEHKKESRVLKYTLNIGTDNAYVGLDILD